MFKSKKELIDKINSLTDEIEELKSSEEKTKDKVKKIDRILSTNNQTNTSYLLSKLICNSNVWLSFNYTSLKHNIYEYMYMNRNLYIDIYNSDEVLKLLDYPRKNAKYWLNFCLSHKYAWATIDANEGVHIYTDVPVNENVSCYVIDFKDYLSVSHERPTETDYKTKYEKLKRYGHDIDDNDCQVDKPMSDLFYCKQVPVLDVVKGLVNGE